MFSSRHSVGVALALLAALGFATKGIFIKFAYRLGVDAETLLAMRMLCAMAIFTAVILGRRLFPRSGREAPAPMTRKDAMALVALGFLGYYLSSWLDFRGLLTLPASVERLILLLYPTFTVLLHRVVLGKPQPASVWAALPICYGGMALVLGRGVVVEAGMLQGALLVAGSTLSYACYLVASPGVIARLGAMRFSEYVMMASGGMVIVHFSLTHPLKVLAHVPVQAWKYGVLLGLVSTVIPLYALSAAIARIGSARTSVLGMLGPLVAVGLSVLLLGERLGALQWVGAAVVMAGVLLAGRKKPHPPAPSPCLEKRTNDEPSL